MNSYGPLRSTITLDGHQACAWCGAKVQPGKLCRFQLMYAPPRPQAARPAVSPSVAASEKAEAARANNPHDVRRRQPGH